jgi:hypothetical protein
MGSDRPENRKRIPFDGRRRAIPPHGGRMLSWMSLIEPAACAAGTGRPRADPTFPWESQLRGEPSMTRRETRKIRAERRPRIEAECLESRNLLSQLGSLGPPELIVHPPDAKLTPEIRAARFDAQCVADAKYATEIKAAPQVVQPLDKGGFNTATIPDVQKVPQVKSVADEKKVTQVKSAIDEKKVTQVKSAIDEKKVPQAKLNPDIKIAPQVVLGQYPSQPAASGTYQTSVWGATQSFVTMKKA